LEVIHPHAFRHHFNYELSVSIDKHNAKTRAGTERTQASPISEVRELDIRAAVNGHRSKSSGARYNRRHIREASDRAVRQIQAGLKRKESESESDGASH
jgi:hypothetical protein